MEPGWQNKGSDLKFQSPEECQTLQWLKYCEYDIIVKWYTYTEEIISICNTGNFSLCKEHQMTGSYTEPWSTVSSKNMAHNRFFHHSENILIEKNVLENFYINANQIYSLLEKFFKFQFATFKIFLFSEGFIKFDISYQKYSLRDGNANKSS